MDFKQPYQELHPGEDQIAEESSIREPEVISGGPNFEDILRPFRIPIPTLPTPVPRPEAASVEDTVDQRIVVPLPTFNLDPEREFAHPFLSMHNFLYSQ